MTERRRDHLATIATVMMFVLIGVSYYVPALVVTLLVMLAIVSLPVAIWHSFRSAL